MRILHLCTGLHGKFDIIPTFSCDLISALSKKTDSVILAPTPYFKTFSESLPSCVGRAHVDIVHYFPIPGRSPLKCLFVFLAVFFSVLRMRKKFDVVHSHDLVSGFSAVLLSRWLGIPALHSDHTLASEHARGLSFWEKWLYSFVFSQTTANIFPSRAAAAIGMQFGSSPGKTKVISNGVSLEKFFKMPKKKARSSVFLPGKKKLILFVGRLSEEKNPFLLLEAFSSVHENNDDVHLVFVGDGPLRASLENKALSLSCAKKVFFAGPVPHSSVCLWMNAADLLVVPSKIEGWPTVLFEAFACGLPVVAARVGGLSECISAENGILFESENILACSNAIQRALRKKWVAKVLYSDAKKNTWWKKAQEYALLCRSAAGR